MKRSTKQLLAGITVGALLITGGVGAYEATAHGAPHMQKHEKGEFGNHRQPKIDKSVVAENIAKEFGVNKDEVTKALESKGDFRDVGHAAMLAKISGKSFSEVFAMRDDWQKAEQTLGVSREDIRRERNLMTAARIADNGNITKDEAVKLMTNGYRPHDIEMAALIAVKSGKDVQTVLDAKKINNRWDDVAKVFGVDSAVLKENKRQMGHREEPRE